MNGSGCPDGNKCLDSRKGRWDAKRPEKKEDVIYSELKGKGNRSIYCEAPGAGDELNDIAARVDSFLTKTLPKRPNGEEAVMPPKEERARTKSPKRRTSQERRQPKSDIPQGFDVWQAGEDYMTQRRQVLKVLQQA